MPERTALPPIPLRQLLSAFAVAGLLVLALDLITPEGAPLYDSRHYLDIASSGLSSDAPLAAPYAYRFAAPLLVRGLCTLTGFPAIWGFHILAFCASWITLVLAYVLSRMVNAGHRQSLLILALSTFSLFQVRYPLFVPAMVDVEAYPFILLSFLFLLLRAYPAALIVSLIGLLFKEFLLIPPVVLVVLLGREYLRRPSPRPLAWMITAIIATIAVFILPRSLIPVHAAYGANYRIEMHGPDRSVYLENLRNLLTTPFSLGQAVNLLLSLFSYMLPAFLLATPRRIASAWRTLDDARLLAVLHMILVAILAMIGGTNVMIFATFALPVLVTLLALFVQERPSALELGAVVVAVLLFNRIPFPFGTPGGDPVDAAAFYGGWWRTLNLITALRFAEAAGWVAVITVLRWAVTRYAARRMLTKAV